jgi:hypothetical protein
MMKDYRSASNKAKSALSYLPTHFLRQELLRLFREPQRNLGSKQIPFIHTSSFLCVIFVGMQSYKVALSQDREYLDGQESNKTSSMDT